ncbi:MAG: glucose 1-dehydrogenase [Alphaproteobacteria bacterium]|nr:glucose 1-dehydrogenase [Alphaproteobacteria bacterium]
MGNPFDVRGRCILVTGASSGIGHHAARMFAAAGAKVAIAARRADRLEALAKDLGKSGAAVFPIALDVADADACERAIDRVEREFHPIDVLLNNAGTTMSKPILEHTAEDFQRVVDVNLNGAWVMAQGVAKRMATRKDRLPKGGGSIINITSVAAIRTMIRTPAYVSSKAGLAHLTRMMAMELAPYRVRVNSIAPGLFITELSKDYVHTDRGKAMLAKIPMGRPAADDEMDGALLLLASDAGSYITGAEIIVDGGVASAR